MSKKGLLSFLCNRELGKNVSFDCPSNISQAIAEEKSTIPIVNKACDLSGPSRSTFLVAFSSDRALIASTHGDHSVRVTEVKTGKCHHVLHGHPRTPWTIAFHPASNDILATGCLGGQVRIWDLRGGGCEVWKSEDGRVIASLAFHPTDQLLVIATLNEVLFWDWSKPEPFARSKTSTCYERVRWCKFDPFGHYLYTGIANKSTIQSEDLYSCSATTFDLPFEGMGASEHGHLWEQYRRVVDEITAHQRERIHQQQGHIRERNVDPMLQEDIDLVEPSSPQSHALRNAQQYAARITRESAERLRNTAQPPPASSESLPHIEIGRVEGPSAPDFGDTEEHMQQIHRIPNIYANTTQGLDTLAQAAETVSQLDSNSAEPAQGLAAALSQNRQRLDFSGPPVIPRSNLWRQVSSVNTLPSVGVRPPRISNPLYRAPTAPREAAMNNMLQASSRATRTPRPLTQSTLERFLNTSLNQAESSGPPNVNLDFLSEINVSASGNSSGSTLSSAVTDANSDNAENGSGGGSGADPFIEDSAVPNSVLRSIRSRPLGRTTGAVGGAIPPLYVTSRMREASSSDLGQPVASRMSNMARSILLSRLGSRSPVQTSTNAVTSRSPPVLSSRAAVPPRLILPSAQRHDRTRPLPDTVTSRPPWNRSRGAGSPPRDRSLMTLLEAPLSTSPNILSGASSVTNVPQPVPAPEPVPPVSQSALSFLGRNWGVREGLRRANEEPPASAASTSDHACPENCQVCGGYGSFLENYSRRRSALFPSQHSSSLSNLSRYRSIISQGSVSSSGSTTPRTSSSFSAPYSISTATVSIVTPTPTSIITPISTTSSNPAVRTASSDNSPAIGGQSRQPQRLATIIETEVREAINRIRTHEVDISHTLRDLDSLQRNLGVEPSRESDSPSGTSHDVEEPAQPVSEGPAGLHITAAETNNNMDTALEVTVENSPGGEPSPGAVDTTNEGLLAISNISSVLGERIQQLDERVNSIQNRLRESMQALDRRYVRMEDSLRSRSRRLRARLCERRMQRFQEYQNRRRLRDPMSPSLSRMTSRLQQIHAQHMAREQERRERLERRRHHWQWHSLRRRHLHRDYGPGGLDDPLHRQSDLQAAINRTIAGAFISSGEASVASNIVNLTHRIQRWDLNRGIPDISQADKNVVVRSCKLHNDATADISQDGRYLATFVSTSRGFPDDSVLGVFSLQPDNLGQCLYTKSFGPNAISVSISPLNNYIIVGLAAKRMQWVFTPKQMVAQIYKLKTPGVGEDSMEHICDLMHPCDLDLRLHVSVNSARWLPGVGEGVVYCTNRGDLHICKPGWESKSMPANESGDDRQSNYTRQLVMQLLRINSPRTNNSSTQTSTQGVRRTASTQTDQVVLSSDSDSD